MNDSARKALVELVHETGPQIANEPSRLADLLRQRCPDAKRELSLLRNAADGGATEKLREPLATPEARAQRVSELSKTLEEQWALAPDAARWAVESWALALGALKDNELSGQAVCPVCKASLLIPRDKARQTMVCPRCATPLTVDEGGNVRTSGEAKIAGDVAAPIAADDVLRQTLRVALADGVFTNDERSAVRAMRERLGISKETASRIFAEVCTEMGVQVVIRPAGAPASTFATPAGFTGASAAAAGMGPNRESFGPSARDLQAAEHTAPPTEFRGYDPGANRLISATDRLAIVSVALGILSLPLFFAFVPALAAIVIGAWAARRIRHLHIGGMRYAMLGIIFGAVGLLTGIAWIVARNAR